MLRNSRIPMTGLPHRVSVVRKLDQKVHGVILPSCQDQILYDRIPARVANLRFFKSNFLDMAGSGEEAARLRRIMIRPRRVPNRILLGDFIRIHWGTVPNIYSPPEVPPGLGPEIYIQTPGGEEKLVWDPEESLYVGDTLTFGDSGSGWCLTTEESDTCFDSGDLRCQVLPEGYSFLRTSGPPLDYKIERYQHHIDDRGGYHHTTLQIELNDSDFSVRQ